MVNKMKAALYYGPRDIRVEEIERPRAGEHGIVIKVRAAGICGSDLHPYKVSPKGPSPERRAHGHEVAGDVVEVGANVSDVKVGDRVWVWPFLPCFECEQCKKKNYWRCSNRKGSPGRGLNGGFAEYLWVPAVVQPQEDPDIVPNVIKLPGTMSYVTGVLTEPLTVGFGAVKYAEPAASNFVVVLGAGIIGLGTVVCLKEKGVKRILVTDISEKRLQVAKELGAELVLDPSKEDMAKRVVKETSGRGADIVVETAGKPTTFLQAIEMVRRGGKIMLVGLYEEPVSFSPNLLVLKAIRTIGCIDAHFGESFKLVKAGKFKEKQVVTHTFPLDRITEAFETAINTQESIKVMIEP